MSELVIHPADLDDHKLLEQCEVRRTRRSGPGGQHRNKVETAVVINHQPSGVKAEASERRSQHENHRAALLRLRVNLALDVRGKRGADQTPSELWKSRCRNGRITINAAHADFPRLLAEALDVLNDQDWNIKKAAALLDCTVSQFSKFLKLDWRADAKVSSHRSKESSG